MPLKTYYPQMETRKTDWPDSGIGILRYDWDNAYPQRVLQLIHSSPTAKRCHDERANYLEGKGFEDQKLAETIVNSKGLTIAKLLRLSAYDMGFARGFAWHVNYNANYEISDIHFVPFENVRMGNPDSEMYKGCFALYQDWGMKSWKRVQRSQIHWLFPFNADPAQIKYEVEISGGWDNYKGQLFYYNPAVNDYPLAECDSGLEDIETDAGLKTFRNRNVRVGFMPAAILMKPTKREETEDFTPDERLAYNQVKSQTDKDLIAFQGADRSSTLLVMEYSDESEKPELVPYTIQNNDKLFDITNTVTKSAIITSFSVPEDLIISEKGSSLKTGGEKKAAIHDFNDRTQRERRALEQSFALVFDNFPPVGPQAKFSILPVPSEDIENQLGMKAGPAVNQLLMSTLSDNQKINALITVYGFTTKEATATILGNTILQV